MTKTQLRALVGGLITLNVVLEVVVLQTWGWVATAVFIASEAPLVLLGALLMVGIQKKWLGE